MAYAGTTSNQDVRDSMETPPWLVAYLKERYGGFGVDLFASEENAICSFWIGIDKDSLAVDWYRLSEFRFSVGGVRVEKLRQKGFANPPYSNIDPCIDKAIWEAKHGFTSVFVIPSMNGDSRDAMLIDGARRIIHIVGRPWFINPIQEDQKKSNNRGTTIFEFGPIPLWQKVLHWFGFRRIEYVQKNDLIAMYGSKPTKGKKDGKAKRPGAGKGTKNRSGILIHAGNGNGTESSGGQEFQS